MDNKLREMHPSKTKTIVKKLRGVPKSSGRLFTISEKASASTSSLLGLLLLLHHHLRIKRLRRARNLVLRPADYLDQLHGRVIRLWFHQSVRRNLLRNPNFAAALRTVVLAGESAGRHGNGFASQILPARSNVGGLRRAIPMHH